MADWSLGGALDPVGVIWLQELDRSKAADIENNLTDPPIRDLEKVESANLLIQSCRLNSRILLHI